MAAVIAFGFSACTDDQPTDNNNTTSSPIVAKWEITDFTTRVQDSMTNGMLLDTTVTETYVAGQSVIDFKSDGKVITTSNDAGMIEIDTATYTYNAPTLKIFEDPTDMTDYQEFEVSFSGNNVSMKAPDFYETLDLGGLPLAIKVSLTINGKKL